MFKNLSSKYYQENKKKSTEKKVHESSRKISKCF